MTGVDTNVLARFFTEDDPDQARRAEVFLQSLTPGAPGFVSLVSLAELVWVLRRRYGWSKSQLIQCLDQMLDSPEFVLEGQTAVAKALHSFARSKADFADCLIERSGYAAGCAETVTFDTEASKFAGMRLL
jgi:predicted nucleic-acid-binding protein